MKLPATMNPSRARLWLETTFWRFGLLPIVALLFVILGAIAWLLWVPGQSAVISSQRLRQAALEAQLRNGSPQTRQTVEPITLFERTLADPAKTNDVIRRIFELSRDSGVTITQADYRRINDKLTTQTTQVPLEQFQIVLPVKGEYAALKRFCLSLLSELPAVSVDQLTLKREQLNGTQVDGQLLLSLWQHGTAHAGEGSP
ncbi:MAG TPA: GspMb/PilO family protein [Rhodocyclaceae bacterium]|nr:GspMb/PilO family protein [Rhodocyclaceae bacterium]